MSTNRSFVEIAFYRPDFPPELEHAGQGDIVFDLPAGQHHAIDEPSLLDEPQTPVELQRPDVPGARDELDPTDTRSDRFCTL